MNKITLGVLFGGVSSEHDISTVSAKGILSAIDKEKYNLVMLGITKEGRWFLFDDDIDLLPEDRWLTSPSLVPAWISPDRSVHGVVTAKGDTIGRSVPGAPRQERRGRHRPGTAATGGHSLCRVRCYRLRCVYG